MKRCLTIILIIISAASYGQALRDINYNYLYNPNTEFDFQIESVRQTSSWIILYKLQVKNNAQAIGQYRIEWQGREALNTKEGTNITSLTTNGIVEAKTSLSGTITIPLNEAPQVLVAKIVNDSLKRAWLYHKTLEANYPVNNFLINNNMPLVESFTGLNQVVALGDTSSTYAVSYYNDKFPTAAPGFSEAQGKVSKALKADSIFQVSGNEKITLSRKGLYLFQRDTLATEGLCIRVESDYPKYTTINNLPGPLIYICTKQEYDRLEAANGDKKIFDRTVLSITGDPERAKKLIRSYFRRVELANQYFTSYKEGWKTDRGMIYIIFGLPSEVYKFNDREVWNYKNEAFNVSFDFVKSSSVFDPENYVLVRAKKYQEVWYEVVDLWRSARF
jgi:GWxTD domain-containing protein